MGVGIAAAQATQIVGNVADNLTATGTIQLDALPLAAGANVFSTVASGAGARLFGASDIGDTQTVYNQGANSLNVYPPVGGMIQGLSANAALAVVTGSATTFQKTNNTTWQFNTEFLPSGTGAVARTVQGKLRDSVNLADFLPVGFVTDASVDYSTQILSALNSIDTSGGKGGTVYGLNGAFSIGSTKISIPSRVRFKNAGRRQTIFNYTGNSVAFECDGTNLNALEGCRISIAGAGAAAVALNLKTTSASLTECEFDDLEIVSSNIAGQIGIQAVASGGQIVSENIFSRIYMFQVDKPIIRTSCEGNEWHGIVLSTYGTGASPVAMNGSGNHNDLMFIRVAGIGAGVTTPIAVQETGDQNRYFISGDIGATGKTLNTSGTFNRYYLRRAVRTTPIGTYNSVSESVEDGDYDLSRRLAAGGTALVAGDFALSAGWGATATVSAVRGTDNRFSFTINSAGAGTAANPTVNLTFKDGAWTAIPFIVIGRAGGNQPTIDLLPRDDSGNSSTTVFNFIFAGTPVAGESYLFSAIALG